MVGAGKAVIQDGSVQNLNIRRDKEAVDRQPELPVGIRTVSIAAAGDRSFPVNGCDQNEIRLCDQIAADRLRPRIAVGGDTEILRAAALQQILVEIAAAKDVIALVIFRLHVSQQQLQLLVGDRAVGGVGGQVQVIQAKFFSAFDRHAGDGIAAVKIEKLRQTALHRQTAPDSVRDGKTRHHQKTGAARAVRLQKRVEQERGIIVDGEDTVIIRLRGIQILALVHVIRARGIKIDLLQEIDVGVLALQAGLDLREILAQPLFAPRPRLRPAVHEEAVIVFIRPKTEVPRHGVVDGSGLRFRLRLCGLHLQGLIVRDAVIGDENVGDIAERKPDEHCKGDQQPFPDFFHTACPSGARASPKKNTATVPGPEWDATMVPMLQMRISPSMCGNAAATASFVASASAGQLEWQIKTFPA